jgi:RNA polymerase sigma-70 factor (ECF subfamily)
VRRAVRGDEAAAAAIFDESHPRVFRYALAKVRDPAAADDIASETFARILRDLDRFKWKGAGFEAWLFRIASNLVTDHWRGAGRETAVDITIEDADTDTPELAALRAETAGEVGQLLAQLPPDQREVLLLRFAAGLDTNEVARSMGRKANAVRQLQFRALTNLRGRMTESMGTRT